MKAAGTINIFDKTDEIFRSTVPPESPISGTLWLDTTSNILKRYDGTSWIEVLDSRVASLISRVSEAELKITDDAIVSTVRESSEYHADLNGIWGGNQENLILDGNTTISNADYQIATYSLSRIPLDGETLTVELRGSFGTGRYAFMLYTGWGISHCALYAPDPDGVFRATFNWTAWDESCAGDADKLNVYQAPYDATSTSTITSIALYRKNTIADLTRRTCEAEQKITADAIVSTVRESSEYQGDLSTIETHSTQIAQTNTEIGLRVLTSTYDAGMAEKLGVSTPSVGVTNSSVIINTQGIALTGGKISLSATSALEISSQGSVDIDGATGSMDLGDNSQVSATNGNFHKLYIDGTLYLPIVMSAT